MENPKVRFRILKEIEKTRIAISSDTEANLSIENINGDDCLEQDFDRSEYE